MNKYVEKAPVSEKEQTKDQDQRLTHDSAENND